MALRKRSIFEMIPWWVYVFMAILAYPMLRFWIPSILLQKPHSIIGNVIPIFAPIISGMLLIIAALLAFAALRRGALLEGQHGINSLRKISWREFEDLVAEAYKRKGYIVTETASGADGGVDLILKKGGEKLLVQCKHWRMTKVGVKVVRELYGVVAAEGASEGVVISSGIFTREAQDFARGKPLELIDGTELLKIITEVQKKQGSVQHESNNILCPLCGNIMVIRTAKKGTNTGKEFWGCSAFPKCRGTRPYNA